MNGVQGSKCSTNSQGTCKQQEGREGCVSEWVGGSACCACCYVLQLMRTSSKTTRT